jgi:hypothetical protein
MAAIRKTGQAGEIGKDFGTVGGVVRLQH